MGEITEPELDTDVARWLNWSGGRTAGNLAALVWTGPLRSRMVRPPIIEEIRFSLARLGAGTVGMTANGEPLWASKEITTSEENHRD